MYLYRFSFYNYAQFGKATSHPHHPQKKKKKKKLKFFMWPTNQIFNFIFFFEKWIGYDMSSFPFPLKKSRLYKLGTTVNFGCFFL